MSTLTKLELSYTLHPLHALFYKACVLHSKTRGWIIESELELSVRLNRKKGARANKGVTKG